MALSMTPPFGPASPDYIGAIDQGTSSSRFIVFDRRGTIVDQHQVEFPQLYPAPGLHEHSPAAILASVVECMRVVEARMLRRAGSDGARVRAIGITNQRETTVCWDAATGQPLYNAIVWDDARTAELARRLVDSHPSASRDCLRKLCGLPIAAYFSALKLRWMLDNVEAVQEANKAGTLCFGTIDSWLIYNLTGGVDGGKHVIDVTNASRTMLMDIDTATWSPELLDFFGIPHTCLPSIRSSSEIYGCMRGAGGAFVGVPIAGCLGDQQAALVGQKCFQPGQAKNTYGTGCFMLFNTGTRAVLSHRGLITTVGYQLGPTAPVTYALEGAIAVAGSAVQWLRDSLSIVDSAAEASAIASTVPDTGGVYFVTAFNGLFAPYWREDARGTIVGLTRFTTRAHIARAALEATCFQTRAILDAMNEESGVPFSSLRVDGGMTQSDLTMQVQADIVGISVERPRMRETTALGAAIAAGLAVGTWQDLNEVMQIVNIASYRTFDPSIAAAESDVRYGEWKRAVQRSLDWVVPESATQRNASYHNRIGKRLATTPLREWDFGRVFDNRKGWLPRRWRWSGKPRLDATSVLVGAGTVSLIMLLCTLSKTR